MLWGAFGNASQGMQSMDWAMGTISQNIANVNTTGYKRKDTEFQTVLSETHTAPASTVNSTTAATATSGLNVFGVRPVDRTLVSAQGQIQSTGNWTDLAINGRGFFMVSQPNTSGAPQTGLGTSSADMLYTRAGSFQQKAVNGNNYLVTGGGQYLMGWQADAQGDINGVITSAASPLASSTASTTTTGSSGGVSAASGNALVPVYVNLGSTITGVATANMQTVMNLPSNAAATGSTQTFTDTSSVTDGTGAAQNLTMTWTRQSGDTWQVDFALPAAPASGSVGTISSGTPVTVTMDQFGAIQSPAGGLQNLSIDWSAGAVTNTTPSINLASQKPSFSEVPLSLTVYDANYQPQTLPVSFERDGNGQWNMRIKVPAADGVVSGLTESGGTVTQTPGTYSVPIQFDGSGKIQGPNTISFSVAWDPTTHPQGGTNTISIDVSKLTQYAGATPTTIAIKSNDQDGYASGTLSGASFNDKGELIGNFSDGRTRTLFMVPVATFTSPNQLDAISGTMFRATADAGAVTVDQIADQGSGAAMVAGAVETSNVTLEDEFTRMIVTQKAYSVNAEVFKTADEMTTSVRDLIT